MSAHGPRPDPWRWREELLAAVQLTPAPEQVALEQSVGRVLAEDRRSPEDVPALPVSAMDGFALRATDLPRPAADGTVELPVSADHPARPGAAEPLRPGTAARIMTGAPVPAGADLVVEVEATDADPHGPAPSRVRITLDPPGPHGALAPGRHVRGPGEELRCGELLAAAGQVVRPGLVGIARALGIGALPVLGRVRVAVVVTGDELHGTDHPAPPGTVRESNGTMLAAALREHGAEPRVLTCGDDPAELEEVLHEAARGADLVLTTGGIGHGAFDVVKMLLGERGTGGSRFAHLALRPGGPQGRGTVDGVPLLHLPGTPVGAFVGHHLFVRPLLPGQARAAAPRRAPLLDPEGRIARTRSRAGLVIEPGRWEADEDGRHRARVLPGRRLTPYGAAELLVLGGAGAATEEPGTALVVPL